MTYLTVKCCSKKKSGYGTWLVIYSILGWTAFLNPGLGNGMKTKLSEALALNDRDKAKKIVSTNYTLLFCIAILLITGFTAVHYFIDWQNMPNANKTKMYSKTVRMLLLLWGGNGTYHRLATAFRQ